MRHLWTTRHYCCSWSHIRSLSHAESIRRRGSLAQESTGLGLAGPSHPLSLMLCAPVPCRAAGAVPGLAGNSPTFKSYKPLDLAPGPLLQPILHSPVGIKPLYEWFCKVMLEAHNDFVDIKIIELVICLWLESGFPSPLTVHIFRPRCCQDSWLCPVISSLQSHPHSDPSQQDVIGVPQASLLQFILRQTCGRSTYLTSLFLGFMGFLGGSVGQKQKQKTLPANAGDERDLGFIPGSGRTPREGHGNPL